MIKCRFYCPTCRLRVEAEIVYDKRTDRFVYAYNHKEAGDSPQTCKSPICPECHSTLGNFKVVRDVPDRYIDENGNVCIREYKEL